MEGQTARIGIGRGCDETKVVTFRGRPTDSEECDVNTGGREITGQAEYVGPCASRARPRWINSCDERNSQVGHSAITPNRS